MSDDGDRTCPLCAEEMDITDQQLKPCKCGYELYPYPILYSNSVSSSNFLYATLQICVWCWHHIIDMAEKEETEGRCPACRTPYDKDRIVKMAATCERTVAEKNAEKKQKTQKVKPKVAAAAAAATTTTTVNAEAKKHLASVRVIQRNLVYVIGLPANLCNESVLERREYFGQYGKVLKVSVSRPTGPPSQQASSNNNISVYITYAKEEEAIRCIQAVHNFVLEGKVLRACFGTTKYCHAWLRNLTCGNPDCLYLHDVGSQEDSFTKDEIISAYTRTRVPQMVSSVSQRRAGTVLPPPADDFSYSAVVSARHTVKNGTINTNNQPRLSPPNSSSGRPALPPAASWGHRDLNARTTGTGVTSSVSLSKPKSEPQSSSSMISSTRIPSSWNDDTSAVPKISEGRQVSEKDGSSKTLEPYKPGIAKETQALSSLNSSLDIDFSSIPSAWNDDDTVVSDEMSKGNEENQVANGNGKLTHSGPKSPKKDTTVSSTSRSPSDIVSSVAISIPDVKIGDDDHPVASIAPRSPASKNINCHLGADKKILEDVGPKETDIEKLSVWISSVTLDVNDEAQSMAGNQQPDAMPCTSVAEPLPSENNKNVRSCQYGSDKHLDWSSDIQSCSAAPLNSIGNSSLNTDKHHMTLLDGTIVPSYSSFIHLSDASDTSLWDDTESDHTLTIRNTTSSLMQTKQSSTNNTYTFVNGVQDGLGTVHTHGNVSGHPGMDSHQHGAISVRADSIGNFDKTISVNKDENRIISDILLSEFDPWDASYANANNYARMLRESENNDVPFTMPSWKSGNSSKESRFAFARQDNQGNMSDASLRNCGNEKNFSLLSQNSRGNVYQNGLSFQSLENTLAMSDMTTSGTSRSKIPAPPGFSAPARVPPPGFSSGFPSQDGLNPPPGFSSGIPSRDGTNPAPRFPSGISSQDGSNPSPRFPSAFSSGFPSQDRPTSPSRFLSAFSTGFPSQDGPNSPSRFHSAFSSGFPVQDGSNPPTRLPSAFSSGFSSQGGSSQVYGSAYSETPLRDNLLGGLTNHYEPQLARHTSDIEFVDPAILAVGKGRMPGIGDSGLEMKNTSAFPAQLQTSNKDQRIQLLMQQNVQSHQNTHIHDPFNIMSDNYLASRLLAQNHGSLSPYAQMPPPQPRSAHLTNGHWDGWSELRQGSNAPISDMSRIYPSEANNLHMMGSNDLYHRAFGM